jgi:serine/threonine protein kinase
LNLGSHGSFINHVTQLFAVKRLKVGPHQPSAPNLVDEVFVLGQLCHPNIVSFVDLIEARQHKFIVMEYCEGGDLRNMISKASLSM